MFGLNDVSGLFLARNWMILDSNDNYTQQGFKWYIVQNFWTCGCQVMNFLNLGLRQKLPLSQPKWQVSFELIFLPFPSVFLGDSWSYHQLDSKRFLTVPYMKFLELYKYNFRFFKVR